MIVFPNLSKLLRLRNQLVSILAEVLLGLEDAVGHGDELLLLRHGFTKNWVSGEENEKSDEYLRTRGNAACLVSSVE